MINVYKIFNLKSDKIYEEDYLFREDAERAFAQLQHPYIHEIYEEERVRLSMQTINVRTVNEERNIEHLSVSNLRREHGTIVGDALYRRVRHEVAYDTTTQSWNIVVPEKV